MNDDEWGQLFALMRKVVKLPDLQPSEKADLLMQQAMRQAEDSYATLSNFIALGNIGLDAR